MIRDITIGRYFDSESVIHLMDPRTKLMGAIVYIISLFLVKNPLWYLLCLAVILTLYKIAKEDIQEVQKHQECIRWYMSKEIFLHTLLL